MKLPVILSVFFYAVCINLIIATDENGPETEKQDRKPAWALVRVISHKHYS